MGKITQHNIKDIKDKYNLAYFFETGTWKGGAIDHCLQFGFEALLSVDIVRDPACDKFQNQLTVRLFSGKSLDQIPTMLKEIPAGKNALFWLDAHLPSYYSDEFSNTEFSNIDLTYPLEGELQLIKSSRDVSKDFFIIDDMRIYERSFSTGDNHRHPTRTNAQFIGDLFAETHTMSKDFRDEGYVILTPKSN